MRRQPVQIAAQRFFEDAEIGFIYERVAIEVGYAAADASGASAGA